MPSQPPAVVVFDLGKVLLEFDYGPVIRHIAAKGRISAAALHELLLGTTLLLAYERGEFGSREFFRRIVEATGYEGTFEEFTRTFSEIFAEIPSMIALHAELRRLGVPTYIFSNTNELAIDYIRRAYPFFANFNAHVLSYEHGSMKPDAPLYDVVERVTGRRGADILYIDDRPENCDAGRARGWQVIFHQDPAATRAAVAATGLLGSGTGGF
jgi:HAD superfamily hydrolase (TIGR01509 family)